MKLLVFILIVANAAFFTWRYNARIEARVAAGRAATPLPSGIPTLKLIGELDELPPPRAAADTAAETATPASPAADSAAVAAVGTGAPSGVCVRIGPYAKPAEYEPLRRWLAPRATRLELETSATTKRQLFWVYLEPENETEAHAKLADLKRQGVKDYLLINRNGIKNAISLGVFSTQEAVNRRLAEMTKKGYSPLVVPRVETTDMYWLRAELASGHADSAEIPTAARGNAGVEPLDCEQLGAARAPPRP